MSGLFGSAASTTNNGTNASASKSLFDRITPADPAKSTATATPSLFGTAGTSAAQPTTTTTTTSGLFGAAAQPSTGTGLFGSAAQPAKTTGGGLFGSLNATSTPASTGTSLFGKPASTGGTGLFGASAQPTTTSGTTGLFGSLAPAATSTQPAASSLMAPPQQNGLDSVASNPAYFDQLLERGRKRQTEENLTPFGDLPQLELGLADISRKVRNLGQGGPSAGLSSRNGDLTKAHYLLSASGVNTNKAMRDLDNLSENVLPLYESELNGTMGVKRDLARKYKDDFQQMIDSHIKSANDDFNKMIDEQLHGVDWTAYRQRIYEHFGLKKPQATDEVESGAFGRSRKGRSFAASNGKSFGLPGMSRSVIGSTGVRNARQSQFADVAEHLSSSGDWRSAPEDRASRARQDKYIEQVKELNIARPENPFAILNRFSEVEDSQPTENTVMLVNAYRALAKIVGEDRTKASSDPGAVKQRQYASAYLDDGPAGQASTTIRKRIIEGSRTFLESQFYSSLETTVTKNPREANVGGIPTAIAKVKGYVRVRAARRELGPDVEILQEVAGDYCWAVIFYLLRAGLVKEATEYVDENANAFRHIDRKFMAYLRHYSESPERRLSHREQTDINNDYAQRTKLAPEDSIDPYRMMCYKVIGRCDISRRTIDTINSDMMDFLWLQFALAREYNRVDEYAHEAFGLEEIRTTVKDVGERYFGPNSDIPNAPTTYFFMQILAGMFEKAIADLYPH